MYKILVFALLAACAQAAYEDSHQHHQATSFIKINDHHNSVHHVHSAPAQHHVQVAPAVHHAAPAVHHVAPVVHHAAPAVHHVAPVVHHAAQVHKVAVPVVKVAAPFTSYSSHQGSELSLGQYSAHTGLGAHGSGLSFGQHSAPLVHHAAPLVHHAAPVVHHAPVAKVVTPVHVAAPAHHESHHHEEVHSHPKYQFAYGVEDHHTGDIHSHKETRDGDVTHGEYSLHEADGTIRTVKYTVDKHSGFNAVVERKGHAQHVQPAPHHQPHYHH